MKELAKKGIEVFGIDGSDIGVSLAAKQGLSVERHDLREPYVTDKFDVCICIEVAEHIGEEHSKILADTLAGASDTIIFTAASKNQCGVGHMNVQPKKFWIDLFKERGFELSDETEPVSRELFMKGMLWYIARNLMVFRRVKKC
jgi:hypothetical protein